LNNNSASSIVLAWALKTSFPAFLQFHIKTVIFL